MTARKLTTPIRALVWLFVAMPNAARTSADLDWVKEQQFWSFRKPSPQASPSVKDSRWPRVPLDRFVLASMEAVHLKPAAEADRRTYIRRATLDILGLPPTPDEIEAFLADRAPGAHERLVDRLLASPRFGERMASLWLPLARYAQDQAHQVGDETQYFYPNAYKYRDWVIGAFNRDLPYDQFIRLQLAADLVRPGEPKPDSRSPDLAALGFLGLGPKYYDRGQIAVMADEWEDRVDTVARALLGMTVSCARCHDHKFDPITAKDYYSLAGVFASTKMVNRRPDGTNEKDDARADKMDPGTIHIVEEGAPTTLNVFIRGNPEQKGPAVPRRFLRILCQDEPRPFEIGSGRRELADAIASVDNPLTARVFVNRVWGMLFGRPIVASPSDFGHRGARPTNQALLDDLACRFMANGWSTRKLIRGIVLSATYRQSCAPSREAERIDPANTRLSHMNRRRLTVEQWRDSVLAVSGELNLASVGSVDIADEKEPHRTVCARISRLSLNPVLGLFDYPDANVHAEKRAVTTTPTQKLFLLNSPFILARSTALAKALTREGGVTDESRVHRAYRLLFGRPPSEQEVRLALEYLGKPVTGNRTTWERYAQILLASNEMLYVD